MTVLITGSTDGVGRRVAQRLGQMGARVLVHGRDAKRGDEVVADIRAGGNAATFYQADLASLAEVRRLAERVRADHPRLDILINNAGIGSAGPKGQRQESHDGHELRFAVNYLAGFLLTHLLLPTLRQSAPARIVNVASAGQSPIDFADVMLTRSYSGGRAYTQSKLAQIMMTMDLAEELEGTGVTANAVHPAVYMATSMVLNRGGTPMTTIDEGADPVLQVITSPLAGNGNYWRQATNARAAAQAYDLDARRQLRELAMRLTGAP
jgi:NAD(P)-dependent dehydrogenase (short-subunit alcohol dehydrogenase family)